MAGVSFIEATKRFDDVLALDRLTLEVAEGEFLVLVGPSGCGKSTALRLIAGLEEVTSGSLHIGGVDVTDVEPQDRDLAMVFQSYALYPHKTVRQNIEFPLKSRKVPKPERRRQAEEAATLLGIGELLERRPGQLSGGQRQRVALARAIVRRPRVFLMDEPLSNLDAKTRVLTRTELSELHRALGVTVVYVTHDQVEAMTMGDRVAVLDGGRLQQVGSPADVYRAPANLFVAGFVGSPPMNTVAAGVVTGPNGPRVRLGPTEVALPPGAAATLAARGLAEVVVGVRPEHLRLGDTGPVGAIVRHVESLGHERHVVCRIGAGGAVAEADVIVREPVERPEVSVGEPVRLDVEPDRLHLFDPVSTERLGP
jgi:multiple sugar transport system ATP-binding protein